MTSEDRVGGDIMATELFISILLRAMLASKIEDPG